MKTHFPIEQVRQVEGWLTDSEMKFLYSAACRFAPLGPIVEIGSWKGKSTICLGLASMHARGGKIYAIDPHIMSREDKGARTFRDFKKNISSFSLTGRIEPMVMTSEQAAKKWPDNKKISMLWVDGSHEYEDVSLDFDMWSKSIMEGGLIAFHDSFHSGPNKVISSNVIRSGDFSMIGHVDYITFAIKMPSVAPVSKKVYSIYFSHVLRNLMRSEEYQPDFFRKAVKKILLNDMSKLE